MIDLLQALEKFVAVRDTGDGTAFKVDGMRAGKYVGQAGDSRGTKTLLEEDGVAARSALDAYREEVQQQQEQSSTWGTIEPITTSMSEGYGSPQVTTTDDEAAKAREALQFFFSKDGELFRTFLLDEVVRAADALSRDALTQLTLSPAAQVLDVLPSPFGVKETSRALFSSLSPPLSETDQKVLKSIRKLTDFFLGNLDLDGESSTSSNGAPDAGSLERARSLIPVLQENQEEMRLFGLQIVRRLTELQTSRALGFVRERVAAR
jgi:aarF domain-containing kinase